MFTTFEGECVRYEELVARSDFRDVHSFASSRNLGNRSHRDPRDAWQSYACWVRALPDRPAVGLMWYFLLPAYGIALELRDGTCGSWDGCIVDHCTLVPCAMPPGDAVLSLYLGVYARVESAALRREQMVAALANSRAERALDQYVELVPGETVWVRYYPTADRAWWLRATGELRQDSEGHPEVRWLGQHGPMRGTVESFSMAEVHDHMVRAGDAPTHDALVG
jgi:hypothetical protein